LLVNGGFETNIDGNKIPDNWIAASRSSDRLRCNIPAKFFFFAAEGECAYIFVSRSEERSTLAQKPTVSNLLAGDRLSLIAYMGGRGKVNLRVSAKLTYHDGTMESIKLGLKHEVYVVDYTVLQETFTLPKDVIDVKVTILNRGTSGRAMIDGVQLVHLP
jgi:hypothetical protein